jgi:hypothetical protein
MGLGTGTIEPLPTTVVIAPDGSVVQRFEGGIDKPEELRKAIAKAQAVHA